MRKLLTQSGLHTELRPLVESGVTSMYDRHSYDAEKRIALDAWARTLTAIIEEQDGATVVPFARAYMDDLTQKEVTAALQRDKDLYLKTRNPRYVRHAYGLARAALARGMRIPISADGSSTGSAIPGWVLRHLAVSHALQHARDRYQQTGHPRHVGCAYLLARKAGVAIPTWVLDYFDTVALTLTKRTPRTDTADRYDAALTDMEVAVDRHLDRQRRQRVLMQHGITVEISRREKAPLRTIAGTVAKTHHVSLNRLLAAYRRSPHGRDLTRYLRSL